MLQHIYDSTGQLTGLTWAGQPLVSGISWSPLGQPTGWSWNLPGSSGSIAANRTYNTAGQLATKIRCAPLAMPLRTGIPARLDGHRLQCAAARPQCMPRLADGWHAPRSLGLQMPQGGDPVQQPRSRRPAPPTVVAPRATPSAARSSASPRPATDCAQACAQLPAVPSTLLIPLAARAHGGRYFPWLDCGDAVAARLLERLEVDASATLDDLPTVLNVLWRTRAIKEAGAAFFLQHPQGSGVNLGCGLTNYFQWLDTGGNQWVDADLPAVMALRNSLLAPRGPRQRHGLVDLTEPGWWRRLGLAQGAGAPPVLVVCEGVLMYLQPEQVRAVLAEFAQHAPPGSRLVLDALTRQAVGRASVYASVGATGAEFCWGVGRMAELADAHPRLALLREQSVSECYGWAGLALDVLTRPWLGAPLYGLATLGVEEGAG